MRSALAPRTAWKVMFGKLDGDLISNCFYLDPCSRREEGGVKAFPFSVRISFTTDSGKHPAIKIMKEGKPTDDRKVCDWRRIADDDHRIPASRRFLRSSLKSSIS
jgi:hypothetical protein